ncbi:hypothetical protein KSP39_PZI011622 [Platanthera zijinensis]|uniref:Co-chaperone protein p23 n=1 Tax=Platanthera zijinensis TaxID=2320716 RepID=A0AAP0BHL5_9ASPA
MAATLDAFPGVIGPDNNWYDVKMELYGKVDVETNKLNSGDRSIFCVIEKEEKCWWKKLLCGDGKLPHYVKVDWDKWVDEDEDDLSAPSEDQFGGMDFSKFGNMGGMDEDDGLDDHFDCGFKFPLLWEAAEIFEHYGVVPGQLAPNSMVAICSFIAYLRAERIEFSLKVFRKIFSVRSITPTGDPEYKGIIYFYCRGMKVVGLPNKIHNWTSRYLIFEGDLGFLHTSPQLRADADFKSVRLNDAETAIVKFLDGARLDVDYYIPLLPGLYTVSRQETTLAVPANLPVAPAGQTPTQGERRKEIAKKRREDGDPAAGYSSDGSFDIAGFGEKQKDLRGNPMIHWHEKKKYVRLSTALPSWRSPRPSRHAHVALSALYGKQNLRDLQGVAPDDLPLLAAQASANAAVTNHFLGRLTRELLRDNARHRKESDSLKERNKRLGAKVNQYKEDKAIAYEVTNPDFQKAMFPFVRESVEVALERVISDGYAKAGVDSIPFLKLFPELKDKVAEFEQADKGKAVAEDDEEESADEEVASSQQQGGQSDQSANSSSGESSSRTEPSAASHSDDSSNSDSGGYSPIVDVDGSSPEKPADKKQRIE